MFNHVSPKLYHKYKVQVLELSPAIQYYDGTIIQRESSSLTDEEIAKKLGLTVEEVTEIRCIAEIDTLPSDAWEKAEKWKLERYQKAFSNESRRI